MKEISWEEKINAKLTGKRNDKQLFLIHFNEHVDENNDKYVGSVRKLRCTSRSIYWKILKKKAPPV